jgi:uncharacterized integral membrane protein
LWKRGIWKEIEKGGGTMANFITILVIMGVVALFSVQNAKPVEVSFLMWKFEASLAVVIVGALGLGALMVGLMMFWRGLRKSLGRKGEKGPEAKPGKPGDAPPPVEG